MIQEENPGGEKMMLFLGEKVAVSNVGGRGQKFASTERTGILRKSLQLSNVSYGAQYNLRSPSIEQR